MRKKLFWLFLISLGSWIVPFSVSAITTSPYYPIHLGNSWTYNWTLGADSGTATATIDAIVDVNGVDTVVQQHWLEKSDQGVVTDEYYVYVTNDQNGIRIHSEYDPSEWVDGFGYTSVNTVFDPPLQIVYAEATIGSSIQSSGIATVTFAGAHNYYLVYTMNSTVQNLESVTVPAGTYDAIKLDRSMTLSGDLLGASLQESWTETDWLVQYIGNIKNFDILSTGTFQAEMTSTNVVIPVNYHDFNGDHVSEILWRNSSDGQNRIWVMDGFDRTFGANIMNLYGAGWEVGGTADFDADGMDDIMWRNQGGDGQNRLWLMDGFTRKSGNALPLMTDTTWTVGEVDDFDGDDQADILWRNSDRPISRIWLMDSFSKKSGGTLPILSNDWIVSGAGDFDRDGKADILWRNTVNGQNRIWFMDGLTRLSGVNIPTLMDTNWLIVGVGDFDADGRLDILWRNPSNGENRIWLMDGPSRKQGAMINSLLGTTWDVGSIGDYNADGKSDILWRDTATGFNMVWLMDGITRLQKGSTPWLDTTWSAVQ